MTKMNYLGPVLRHVEVWIALFATRPCSAFLAVPAGATFSSAGLSAGIVIPHL